MLIRNALVAIGLLIGSYLMAALVNASPVIQAPFRASGRVRVIVVVPRGDGQQAEPAEPAEIPASAVVERQIL